MTRFDMKWERNWMKWKETNKLKWNDMKWNAIIWNDMKCNEMKWNDMKWNEMMWNKMQLYEMIWNELHIGISSGFMLHGLQQCYFDSTLLSTWQTVTWTCTLPYNDPRDHRDHWGRLQNSKLPKLKQNSRQIIDSHLASTNLLAWYVRSLFPLFPQHPAMPSHFEGILMDSGHFS